MKDQSPSFVLSAAIHHACLLFLVEIHLSKLIEQPKYILLTLESNENPRAGPRYERKREAASLRAVIVALYSPITPPPASGPALSLYNIQRFFSTIHSRVLIDRRRLGPGEETILRRTSTPPAGRFSMLPL